MIDTQSSLHNHLTPIMLVIHINCCKGVVNGGWGNENFRLKTWISRISQIREWLRKISPANFQVYNRKIIFEQNLAKPWNILSSKILGYTVLWETKRKQGSAKVLAIGNFKSGIELYSYAYTAWSVITWLKYRIFRGRSLTRKICENFQPRKF